MRHWPIYLALLSFAAASLCWALDAGAPPPRPRPTVRPSGRPSWDITRQLELQKVIRQRALVHRDHGPISGGPMDPCPRRAVSTWELLETTGTGHEENGRPTQAVEVFSSLMWLWPDHPRRCVWALHLASSQAMLGDKKALARALREAAASALALRRQLGPTSPPARQCATETRQRLLQFARSWWSEGGRDHWTGYLGMRLAADLYDDYLASFSDSPDAPVVALERARLVCGMATRGIGRFSVQDVKRAFARVGEMESAGHAEPQILEDAEKEGAACRESISSRSSTLGLGHHSQT